MSENNKNVGLPNPLATNAEKLTDKYGLQMAKSFGSEWFGGSMIGNKCTFSERRVWIENKRLRVRGLQDPKKYKEHMSRQEGDLTYLNLDWNLINYTGKYCNLVANGIGDENYRLDIRAIDKVAVKMKHDKQQEHKKNMRTLPLLKDAKAKLGIDMIPKGFIPEDDEELDLYMEIKDKPKVEIAEEQVINFIKKTNRWHNIETSKNKDLVELDLAVARVYTDPTDGIKLEYRDPENFGHSYVEKNDFSDATYFFVVDTLTINDIKRESGFTDEKLRQIAKAYSKTSGVVVDFERSEMNVLDTVKCDVMRFAFKTTKTTVYKKLIKNDKAIKISKRDENYNPSEERTNYSKLVDTKDTWFEGNYIVGTDYIYDYKECENLTRDEMNKVRPPYIAITTSMYKNKLHSFLSPLEPLDDQMQYINLKMQHLIAELKPDIVEIDDDLMAELEKKGRGSELLNMLNTKGVVFRKRIDMGEAGIKEGLAARPSSSQQGSALMPLLSAWAHYDNLMRAVSGVNPAADGSLPSDALLGVSQMAQLATNKVTAHIVKAATDFNKMVAEVISSRVHDIFSSKKEGAQRLRDIYIKAIGKHNIDALEVMKDRHLHDFGFTVEMIPSQQEMADFNGDLAIALQEGTIDVETKVEAQQIARSNIKLATQFLLYKRRKKIKERLEEQAQMQKFQTESNQASAKSAAENAVQSYGLKIQMDLEKETAMSKIRMAELQAKQEIESPVNAQEFKQEVYLQQLAVASNFELNKFRESAKDLRIDKQSTQQSKMIQQRKVEGAPPIDFEDSIFGDIFNTN